jgi:branched-chain amino acid transport system ATP-binding protein
MMDEPSLGLAPLIIKEIFEIIKAINKDGISVLLVEQNSKAALQIAHRGYVIETGKIVTSGSAKDLMNDETIQASYLGKK